MAEQVTKKFIVEVIGKGLKEVVAELKAMNSVTEKTTKTQKKHTKGAQELRRNLQGTAHAGANTTKSFSKMQQGMTGIVPIYASVAANIFALTAAFGALSRAADVTILTKATEEYGKQTGVNLLGAAKDVKTLTLNMVSLQEATRHTAIASAAGFDTSTIKELTKVARNASIALGRDMADSLNRVVKGAIKAEPELLDELGIILRLEPATRKYAAQLGKTVQQLTTFEKQQAVVNEVISQGNEKFKEVSDNIDINPYTQLAATFQEVAASALNLFNKVLGPAISFFANNVPALTALLILFGSSILKKTIPILENFGIKMKDISAKATENAKTASEKRQAAEKAYLDTVNRTKSKLAKAFVSQGQDIQNFAQKAVADLTAAGKKIPAGLAKLALMPAGTPEQAAQARKVLGTTLKHLEQGHIALGLSGKEAEQHLKSLHLNAGAYLQEHNRQLKNIGTGYSTFTQRVTAFAAKSKAAFASLTAEMGKATTITALEAFTGGLESMRAQLRTSLKEAKGFRKFMVGLSSVIGGVSGLTLRWIPIIGQLIISYQVLTDLFVSVGGRLGWLSKEKALLVEETKRLNDSIQTVSESTVYYNDKLKTLPKTVQNTNKQLDHQINRLQELSSIISDVGKKAENIENLGNAWDKFLGIFGQGALGNLRKNLELYVEVLKNQGFIKEVNKILKETGKISEANARQLLNMRDALEELTNTQLRSIQKTQNYNTSLKEAFSSLDSSIKGIFSGLPTLDKFDVVLLNITTTLEKIKSADKTIIGDLFATEISPESLAILNIPTALVAQYDKAQEDIKMYIDAINYENKRLEPIREQAITLGSNISLAEEEAGLEFLKAQLVEAEVAASNLGATLGNTLIENRDRLKQVNENQKSLTEAILENEEARKKEGLSNTEIVTNLNNRIKLEEESIKNRTNYLNDEIYKKKILYNNDKANLVLALNLAQLELEQSKSKEESKKRIKELETEIYNIKNKIKNQYAEETKTLLEKSNLLALENQLVAAGLSDELISLEVARAKAIALGLQGKELDEYITALKESIRLEGEKKAGEEKKKGIAGAITTIDKIQQEVSTYGLTDLEKNNKDTEDKLKELNDTRTKLDAWDLERHAQIEALKTKIIKQGAEERARIEREQTYKAIQDYASAAGSIASILERSSARRVEKVNERYSQEADIIEEQVNAGVLTREQADKKLNDLEKKRVKAAEAAGKKQFEMNKKLQTAQTLVNTYAGAMSAFNETPGPFWVKAAAAAAALALGTAQLHAINSTSFDSGASINQTKNIGTSPVGQPQAPITGESINKGTTYIRVEGKKGIVYSADTMDELLDKIEEAVSRGDRIIVDKNSRNGLELRS